MQRIALTLVPIAILLVSAHGLLTTYSPPFDGPLDVLLHIVIIAGKLAVLICFPAMLLPLHSAVHGKLGRLASFCGLALLWYLLVAVIHVSFTREPMAIAASDDVVRHYYVNPGPLDRFHYIGLEEWRADWARFIPQLKDLITTIVVLSAIMIPLALIKNRLAAALLATFTSYLVVMTAPPALGLIRLDYDFFLGGILWDAAWLDLFPLCLPFFDISTLVFLISLVGWYALIACFSKHFRNSPRQANEEVQR